MTTVPPLVGSERKLALLVADDLDFGLLDHAPSVDCEEEEVCLDVK
jgi:hypothetical protein